MKKNWKDYQTASAYTTERFPTTAISAYADDETFCIFGESPTIGEVAKHYIDSGLADWLGGIVKNLCKMTSVYAAEEQVKATADIIKKRYSHLKLSEIMLFASKFMAGDYEQFFGKFDSQVILKSLNSYVMYRNKIRSRSEQDDKRKSALSKVDGQTGLSQYQQMLQQAVYGDKDAFDALHLVTYEDMVRCVAMSVRMHGMPEKILEHIKPEYLPLVEEIRKGNMNFNFK